MEIILLKARLEQTEKAMERIFAQMGANTQKPATEVKLNNVTKADEIQEEVFPQVKQFSYFFFRLFLQPMDVKTLLWGNLLQTLEKEEFLFLLKIVPVRIDKIHKK